MKRYAAFLRGINLGRRRVKMADLRRHIEVLDVENVGTILASGNVVFDAPAGHPPELERRIEGHLEGALGFEVDTLVRTMERLVELADPDLAGGAEGEGFIPHVIFVRDVVDGAARGRLADLETPGDRFRILGREVLWLRRGRLSDSSVEPRHLETALDGMGNTMRKLDTVRRLVEKFGGT